MSYSYCISFLNKKKLLLGTYFIISNFSPICKLLYLNLLLDMICVLFPGWFISFVHVRSVGHHFCVLFTVKHNKVAICYDLNFVTNYLIK